MSNSRPRSLARLAPRRASRRPLDPERPLWKAPFVVSTTRGGQSVLLDVVGGRYHTLNEVGGRVWELLGIGATVDTIAHAICAEYGIDHGPVADAVRGDAFDLLLQLSELGLVVQERDDSLTPEGRRRARLRVAHGGGSLVASPALPADPSPPSVARCAMLLTLAKALLTTAGFRGTMRLIHERTARIAGRAAADDGHPALLAATERAVATAAALYPGRALCLEQSLVLYYCLRRAGIVARFRLGYQPVPFAAHAWVECDGEPVNDVPEHIAWFTPLPDIEV